MAFLTFFTFLRLSWRRSSNLLHHNLWASPSTNPFSLLAAIGSDRHLIWSQNITQHKCIATQQKKEFAFTLMYDNRQGYLVPASKVCPVCDRAENLHSQKRKCSFLNTHCCFLFLLGYSVRLPSGLSCGSHLQPAAVAQKYPSSTGGRSDKSYMIEIHESETARGGKHTWRGKTVRRKRHCLAISKRFLRVKL